MTVRIELYKEKNSLTTLILIIKALLLQCKVMDNPINICAILNSITGNLEARCLPEDLVEEFSFSIKNIVPTMYEGLAHDFVRKNESYINNLLLDSRMFIDNHLLDDQGEDHGIQGYMIIDVREELILVDTM